MVNHQQLMRVYGALMWSLGKILNTPEVPRVYIGSFWNQPLVHTTNQLLFEIEEQDLFRDLQSLPRNAALRKLNDFIKRARLAKVSIEKCAQFLSARYHFLKLRSGIWGEGGWADIAGTPRFSDLPTLRKYSYKYSTYKCYRPIFLDCTVHIIEKYLRKLEQYV